MVPDVLHRAREPAVATQERRCVGDRSPAVQLVLGVDREVDADVLAPVAAARLAGPGAGHHERGAGDRPRGQALEDPDVGRMARAEVVGVDDDQLGRRRRSRGAGPGSARPSGRVLRRRRASRDRGILGAGVGGDLLLEGRHAGREARIGLGQDAHRQQAGVAGAVDRHGRHRDALGHLDDGEQAVEAVELGEGHRDPDDRERGDRGQHAGQVGGPSGPGDQDPEPAAGGLLPEGEHVAGRAVGRDDAHLVGDAELVEHVDGPLHDGQVRRAPHDDGDQRASGRSPRAPPPAGRCPSGTGVPRARAADQARDRTASASSPQTVTCPSLRPGRAPLP